MNPAQFSVHASKAKAIEALAEYLVSAIAGSVRDRGLCTLALAGGSTPQALYERLAQSDLAARIQWDKLQIYFGDERCVSREDPSSNYAMAWKALLAHVPIKADQIHAIPGELDPILGAAQYAETLGPDPLDIVLLGMGGDGHTASLFPRGEELSAEGSVVASLSPISPSKRITLTLPSINRARHVLFLVAGVDKSKRLGRVRTQLDAPIKVSTLPAARVRPDSGPALWFVDRAALSQ